MSRKRRMTRMRSRCIGRLRRAVRAGRSLRLGRGVQSWLALVACTIIAPTRCGVLRGRGRNVLFARRRGRMLLPLVRGRLGMLVVHVDRMGRVGGGPQMDGEASPKPPTALGAMAMRTCMHEVRYDILIELARSWGQMHGNGDQNGMIGWTRESLICL